jgi:hypothetical protein
MISQLVSNSSPGAQVTAGIVTTVLVLGFLIAKETVTAAPDRRGQAAAKILDMVIVPLLMVFVAILAATLVATGP